MCFQYEPGRGRFAIAQRDIKVGEFICVDAPIVSHPLPEYLGSNCYHCFKSMKAPLPCPVCTKVMFCSYECRKIALSTYHKYECKIFDFLIASGMSIVCFLAYKAVVQVNITIISWKEPIKLALIKWWVEIEKKQIIPKALALTLH